MKHSFIEYIEINGYALSNGYVDKELIMLHLDNKLVAIRGNTLEFFLQVIEDGKEVLKQQYFIVLEKEMNEFQFAALCYSLGITTASQFTTDWKCLTEIKKQFKQADISIPLNRLKDCKFGLNNAVPVSDENFKAQFGLSMVELATNYYQNQQHEISN